MNTWIDKDTNLEWCTDEYDQMTWREAMNFAKGKSDGWRLPTIQELLTLVDYSKYDPTINDNFSGCKSSHYWSASSYANHSNYAWCVGVNYGYSDHLLKTHYHYIRLVRSVEEMK